MKRLTNLIIGNLFVIALLGLLCLSSCSTQRKIRKAKEVAYQHPNEFADFCVKMFPITPTYIQGKDSIIERTLTVKGDSIPCPKVNNVITYVKCPDTKVIYRDVLRIDTIREESTAKLQDVNNKLNLTNSELDKVTKELKEKKEQSNNRLYMIIGLAIALGGLIWFGIVRR